MTPGCSEVVLPSQAARPASPAVQSPGTSLLAMAVRRNSLLAAFNSGDDPLTGSLTQPGGQGGPRGLVPAAFSAEPFPD